MSADDITGDAWNVALSDAWHALEFHDGESFRWAPNNVMCLVAAFRPSNQRLSIELEPGPGVGSAPFQIVVYNKSGDPILDTIVRGRETLTIDLTTSRPQMHSLRFHVPAGDLQAGADHRILNFRAFRVRVDELPSDVIPLESGYRVGSGWFPLETYSGASFRWVENDAHILAHDAVVRPFELDVEPGPGSDARPLPVEIRTADGRSLASYSIEGRRRIAAPVDPSSRRELVLHTNAVGKPTAADDRTLNFRVFAPA